MSIPRLVAMNLLVPFMVLGANEVPAQGYPNKPIRIITAGAGGGSDIIARPIASAISGPLGQQIIIDNRPTVQGVQSLITSPPDGYHLQVGGNSIWISPLLQNVPWDVPRDFSSVSLLVREVLVAAVHPSVPVKSIKELIALARAKPGELNYASGALGGPSHLGAELVKHMAGVNMVGIAYKSNGLAVTSVISGETQLTITDAGLVMPHAKSGKLRALAVSSAEPSALVPGLPTIAASGVPGYESGASYAMFAPAKTPVPIINRLNQEIVRVLNREDVKEKLFSLGTEVVGNSPQQLAVVMKSEMTRMGKLIRDAGIKAE